MERRQNFELRLSLEEKALRRVVVKLWSEPDASASIENLRFELLPDDEGGLEWHEVVEDKVRKSDQWRETIESVKAKVCELALPKLLEHRMMHMVRPIGSEILRWRLLFREAHLSDSREDSLVHLQQLCWTSAGSVDCKRTAERLIRLRSIDVVKRYELACWYCLEKDISVLWEELPEGYKTSINGRLDLATFKATPLHDYWAQVLQVEVSGIFSDFLSVGESGFHSRAFKWSARLGNKAAAEYFLQKLTIERSGSLVEGACNVLFDGDRSGMRYSFPKENYSDLFFYLLSQMTPEEKVEVFRNEEPTCIFGFLLDWPWQDLLMDSLDFFNCLPECSYRKVTKGIRIRTREGFCFPKLLQDFFLRSPRDFRKHFAFVLFESFFVGCPCIPDSETIEEFLRNIEHEHRHFASSIAFSELLNQFAMRDKWDIVELCLREALHSLTCSESLRETFETFCSYSEKMRTQRFDELLAKIEESANIIKGLELNF